MGSSSLRTIALLSVAFIGQLIGITLLPRTNGFTNPFPTMGCAAVGVFSLWMVARVVQSGVTLGILFPLMAAIMPLIAVIIGIVIYGESASLLKVAVLAMACGLVGLASRMA